MLRPLGTHARRAMCAISAGPGPVHAVVVHCDAPCTWGTGCGTAPLLSLCHRKPNCHRIGTGSLPNRQHPIELRLCDFRARRLVE